MSKINDINEIILNPKNSVKIFGNIKHGFFTVDEQTYIFYLQKIDSPLIDGDIELNGEIYNIAFHNANVDKFDVRSYIPKGGKENVIKIYNTMYKIIIDFINWYAPDYLIIAASDSTKYFPIYYQLTKNNKIPGYHWKTNIKLDGYSSIPMTGVIIAKNNNLSEITENFKKILKKIK